MGLHFPRQKLCITWGFFLDLLSKGQKWVAELWNQTQDPKQITKLIQTVAAVAASWFIPVTYSYFVSCTSCQLVSGLHSLDTLPSVKSTGLRNVFLCCFCLPGKICPIWLAPSPISTAVSRGGGSVFLLWKRPPLLSLPLSLQCLLL